MKHRHIDDKTWSKAALFSLFERGSRQDWIEFSDDLKSDKSGETRRKLMAVAKELGHELFAKTVIESSVKRGA